jgi:hypothetical protein
MLWVSLIYSRTRTSFYSRTRTSLSTRLGGRIDEGKVSSRRWEWGFGKGQWKRRLKKEARTLGMEGRARAIYFLIGAFYRIDYTGTQNTTNILYESIR